MLGDLQQSIVVRCRFLPPCLPDHYNVVLSSEAQLKPVLVGTRLEFAAWLIAWDRSVPCCSVAVVCFAPSCRYAMAAAILEQLSFSEAMRHKAAVIEVSCPWSSRQQA